MRSASADVSGSGSASGPSSGDGNQGDDSALLVSPAKQNNGLPFGPNAMQTSTTSPTASSTVMSSSRTALSDRSQASNASASATASSARNAKGHILPNIDINLAQRTRSRNNNRSNDGSKRPISPHVTITTPTSARHSAAVSSSSPAADRRLSLPAASVSSQQQRRSPPGLVSPVRQNSLGRAAVYAAQSIIEVVSGRTTPQGNAAAGSRPMSASAHHRKQLFSPSGIDAQSATGSALAENESDDDERNKGHGVRRQSSGRWTPTILGGIRRKMSSPGHSQMQGSSTSPLNSSSPQPASVRKLAKEIVEEDPGASEGRKTPARYRPSVESAGPSVGVNAVHEAADYDPLLANDDDKTTSQQRPYRALHPLSHAHKPSDSTASNSSLSIQMPSSTRFSSHSRHASMHASPPTRHSSMQMGSSSAHASPGMHSTSIAPSNASPLIVPQARRGAMNLRSPGSKRTKAELLAKKRRRAALANKVPSKPLGQQVKGLLLAIIHALRCPIETMHEGRRQVYSTLGSIDNSFRDPRTGARVWRPAWLHAYIPLLIWLVVSLTSTFTVLIWHTQVFQGLDRLSTYLQDLGLTGRLWLGSLIFLTTFPPLPLYSTLIILCGFSFGLLQGFVISYIAALFGAVVVFLLSRSLLKSWMVNLLSKSGGLKRVVRAIEKRPKLLFLVRLAPYPYNLMNTLLASSPTLTLQTYTICTALALPKLLIHCALGTSIKNFAAYNGAGTMRPAAGQVGDDDVTGTAPGHEPMLGTSDNPATDATASHTAELVKHIAGFVGLGLCIGIFIYLFYVARKAVDEELDDEDELTVDDMAEYDRVLSDDDELDDLHGGSGDETSEASDLDESRMDLAAAGGGRDGVNDSYAQIDPLLRSSQHQHHQQQHHSRKVSIPLLDVARSNSTTGSTLSHLHKSSILAKDGVTPNFTAPWQQQPNGRDNPYFGHYNPSMESKVSLADSIAELEKHAIEIDQ